MKKIIVIPARYASTRLPGKPLIDILGKPLIRWVYESARKSRLADEVIIATDDERIRDVASGFGAITVMTSPDCRSGTDRVYEAAKGRNAGIVVNVQGDEPDIRADMIDSLFDLIEAEGTEMATLCCPVSSDTEYADPDTVKVVCDGHGFALYFSRSPIPFMRNRTGLLAYKHVGIYGFSYHFLEEFVSMEKGRLEETESLEQLRVLENGRKIRVLLTEYDGFGIDTGDDMNRFCSKQSRDSGIERGHGE